MASTASIQSDYPKAMATGPLSSIQVNATPKERLSTDSLITVSVTVFLLTSVFRRRYRRAVAMFNSDFVTGAAAVGSAQNSFSPNDQASKRLSIRRKPVASNAVTTEATTVPPT